jgi:hypothetical protein
MKVQTVRTAVALLDKAFNRGDPQAVHALYDKAHQRLAVDHRQFVRPCGVAQVGAQISQRPLVRLEQYPQSGQVDHDELPAAIALDHNAAALDSSDHPAAVAAKVPVD